MFEENYFNQYCLKTPYVDTLVLHLTTFERILNAYQHKFGKVMDDWFRNQKILEAGCAMGHVIDDLKKNGVQYCRGYDISNYAIQNALDSVKGLIWQGNHDSELPKIKDKEYDIVFSNSFQYSHDEKQIRSWIDHTHRICAHSFIFIGVTVEGLHRNISGDKLWELQIVKPKKWWNGLFKSAGFNDISWSNQVMALCIK